jgi:hypothetical protein
LVRARGYWRACVNRGGRLLELASGDGFNTKYFYSHRSQSIVACDFDLWALKTANNKNNAPYIKYNYSDVRTRMSEGIFENVV